jgi:hypothetical protein
MLVGQVMGGDLSTKCCWSEYLKARTDAYVLLERVERMCAIPALNMDIGAFN